VNLGVGGTGVAQAVPAVALSPTSLDFGTVTVGSSASRTASIQNTGTGSLSVTGISLCSGTSPEFTWSPSAPLTVAAGQSATLTVTYRPTEAGADTGCVAIATNDPANPTANLQVSGAGSQPPVPSVDADLDIDEVDVERQVDVSKASSLVLKLKVRNRSNVLGIGSATLVGTIANLEVYRQSIPLEVRAQESAEVLFPPYAVAAKSSGTILWRVTVEDQDPDVDVATATTVLGKKPSPDGGNDSDDHGNGAGGAPGSTGADLTAEVPRGTGCSSTGGSAGWLALVGLGLLVGTRRRRPERVQKD
jgi:MYXO-CTERM domain-containing protein